MEREMLIERLARENGMTVEDMYRKITARIRAGMDDPDPERRAQWERIPHAGKLPMRSSDYMQRDMKICSGDILE